MPGKAHRGPRFRHTTFVCVVGSIAALAIASTAFPPQQNTATPVSPDPPGHCRDWAVSTAATQLEAQLATICPQAAHAWRQEIESQPKVLATSATLDLDAPHQTAASGLAAGGRITGIRVAQAGGDWLVSPNSWYVPEDKPAATVSEPRPPDPPAGSIEIAPPVDTGEPVNQNRVERMPVDVPGPALTPPVDATIPLTVAPDVAPGADAYGSPFGAPPIREEDRELGFDPVGGRLPAPHGSSANPASPTKSDAARLAGELAHRELLAKNCYPSAQECATCHQKIYDEWAISSHAYAFVSPMFQKFEQKIRAVSQGTVGHFCYRCHAPVATAMNVGQDEPLWNLSQVEREGVTCIACHRVTSRYTKSNGDRRIEPGDIYDPVYGGIGGDGVAKAIADASTYKAKTSPDEKGPGQAIHREGRYFDQLGKSEFCTSCHQVAVHPGIKLEVVWEQYRQSPARKKGISCQDCHMGKVPGIASGYEVCAIAVVNEKTVCDTRKHGNHTFYGPGYSIAHPGIFPFHKDASRWTMDEWLLFDWRAGWGTDDFEDAIDDGKIVVQFPQVWADVDDRYDARDIVDDNQKRLARKTELRRQVMENGSHVDGPFFKSPPQRGRDLVLHYHVSNTNEGHNLPTASLGAQPQLWANVVLIDPDGQRVWETGYTDHWGDLCDIHSQDVRRGIAPFDSQLFNLQTMFLITGATGTDREFYLPVNVDFDQLPFLRPGAIPTSVTNHPPFIRMESRSIAPLGVKRVKYKIPAEALCKPGTYRLSFRMRSRTEPIYFMRFCDSTIEMQRSMNEGILDIHPYSAEFVVE